MSASKEELDAMMELEERMIIKQFPKVIRSLTTEDYECPDATQDAADFFEKCLQYNVPLGKKRRAMFAISIFRYYKRDASEEEYELVRIAVWSLELLQACFLMADDIVDGSETRRGQTCWCKTLAADTHAVNDVLYLEDAVFRLLRIHCKHKSYYNDLVSLIRRHLDLTFSMPKNVDFTHFTKETYSRVCKYKTSFYTFYLPAAMGMTMAGVKDQSVYDEVLKFLLMLGEYFQIQDDYLDCYGDPEVIGKIGTDIQGNKCSWLIVSALEICTEEQKQIIKENYGSWDEHRVKKVKDIYNDLDIEGIFRRYEQTAYGEMCDLLKDMDLNKFPVPIFKAFLIKISKRNN